MQGLSILICNWSAREREREKERERERERERGERRERERGESNYYTIQIYHDYFNTKNPAA